MKNLIFGSKENLSLEEKYVEALALIAGVLAVLFLPTSYIIPILLITVCGFNAIRAGYTWKRAAWGVAAFVLLVLQRLNQQHFFVYHLFSINAW